MPTTKTIAPYADMLRYIDRYWRTITFTRTKDAGYYIGLPHRFVAPNHNIFKGDQFYWDSYFIIVGLCANRRVELARGMVDNLVHLYKRFKIVPARNRFWNTGISQPPFLTSMALEVYAHTREKPWLRRVMLTAEKELEKYWKDTARLERHNIYHGLSRYCDHCINHITAEHESGWDMTSRFRNQCLNYLPVDLNCCLYKYEQDLAEAYDLLGKHEHAARYREEAARRAERMRELMWDTANTFFFDYNYVSRQRSHFWSVAGWYPLWAKMASVEEAAAMRQNLSYFEHAGGIVNTQGTQLSRIKKQWDYPNGWAPQQWIVVQGLMNYGYYDDARRIAKKWLDVNELVFQNTGKMWEKYNVVKPGLPKADRYENQHGFGWTNAIAARFAKDFFPTTNTQRG